MDNWPRIIEDCYQGDPFKKLVECNGKRYVFNETELIAQQEMMYRSFEMDMRLRAADGMRDLGLPW
jgi:hypothetical protein